jgi:hypothetical protein
MSKDKTLPILNLVRVQNGKLAATDRYTLAIAYVGQPTDVPEATYDGDPFDAPAWTLDTESDGYLTAADVKAKPVKIRSNIITFANGSTKPLATESPQGSDYPNVEKLVESTYAANAPESNNISLNPEHLARFAVTVPASAYPDGFGGWGRHRNEKPTVHFTLPTVNTKPVKITLGYLSESEYVGLIVPIRKAV